MKSSDDLFRLVKSLSKSEKRYFKLSVSKYSSAEESNYIVLFDAIDNQEEYDEDKVKKKFSKGKAAKNFPTEKNHLYRLILKTLRNYSTEQTIENRLKDMLLEAEFLYNKALYDQCGKILMKSKELAIVHDVYFALLEIYELESQLLLISEDHDELDEHLSKGSEISRSMFRKASNSMEYRINHTKAFSLSKKLGDDRRNETLVEELEKILAQPLYKDEANALSFEAKHYFYFMHGVYYRVKRNYPLNYEYSKKDLELYEQNPEIAKEKIHQYVSAIGNFSLAQLEKNEFNECLETLQKLKTVGVTSPSIRVKSDSIYYPRMIAVLLYSGQFEKIVDHIEETKKFLDEYKGKFAKSKEMSFYWNIAYCYFGIENYKEAINWLNRLLNDTALESVRPDMNCYSRIFNMIIHYELGNFDLVEHLIRSTGRYLNKKNLLFALEEKFISFMNKIISVNSEKEKKEKFAEFGKELKRIMSPGENKGYADYFDFFTWIESHVQGISFKDKVRQNVLAVYGKFGNSDHLSI
jgi:hypothetical protein